MTDFTPARLREMADGMRQAFTIAMTTGLGVEMAANATADNIAAALRAYADAMEREPRWAEYAVHHLTCPCNHTAWWLEKDADCTCGLDALRKEAGR